MLPAAATAVAVAVGLSALLASSTPGREGASSAATHERPNVVVVMTDDQTLESARVLRRVSRSIASRGTTFARSIVSFSLCCPSRATFYTGQYAHNHGVLDNHPPAGGYGKLDKTHWLPVWLQRAGYRTAHVGKMLNGYGIDNPDPAEVPSGFDEWYGLVDPSTYRYLDYTINENGRLVRYGTDPRNYQTDVLTRRAVDVIRRSAPAPEPFFLFVGFLAPHAGKPRSADDPFGQSSPHPAPRHKDRFRKVELPQDPSFGERDLGDKPLFSRQRPQIERQDVAVMRERYQQELESLLAVDEGVGAIVRELRRSGELGNTLLLFTSDNGSFHGEHRIRKGKVLPYEPSIRVPLYIRGPGVPRGAVRRQLVTNADLAPTILEAAGAVADVAVDGRSLLPLLADRGLDWGRHLLIEGGDGSRAAFDAIRTYRYLYAEYLSGGRELYDLRRDPFELTNRHGDPAYREPRDLLAGALASLKNCSGEGCRVTPQVGLQLDAGTCVRGATRGIVDGPDAGLIAGVRFQVGRRIVARDRSSPFSRGLSVRRVRPGRRARVRATVSLKDGRRLSVDGSIRRCRG